MCVLTRVSQVILHRDPWTFLSRTFRPLVFLGQPAPRLMPAERHSTWATFYCRRVSHRISRWSRSSILWSGLSIYAAARMSLSGRFIGDVVVALSRTKHTVLYAVLFYGTTWSNEAPSATWVVHGACCWDW